MILTCVPGPLKVIKNSPKVTLLEPSGLPKWPRSRGKIDQRPRTGRRERKRLPKGMVPIKGTLVFTNHLGLGKLVIYRYNIIYIYIYYNIQY